MKIVSYRPRAYEDIVRIEFDRLEIPKDVKDILKDSKFQKFLEDKMLKASVLGDTQLQVKTIITSPQKLVYCIDTECSVVLINTNTKYESMAYGIFGLVTGKSLYTLLTNYRAK
jgi:hypothetical protein